MPTEQQIIGGHLRAAPMRPSQWTGAAPFLGRVCSTCNGQTWWKDADRWQCATCHPAPDNAAIWRTVLEPAQA